MKVSDLNISNAVSSLNCSQSYISNWPITLVSCDIFDEGHDYSREKKWAKIKVYNQQEKPIESFQLALTLLDCEGVKLEEIDPLIMTYHQTFESKQLIRIETEQIIPMEACGVFFNLIYVLYELGEIEYFEENLTRTVLQQLEPILFDNDEEALFINSYILNLGIKSTPKFYHSNVGSLHWGCAVCGCYNLNELNYCLKCDTKLEVQRHFTKIAIEKVRLYWIANRKLQAEQELKLQAEQELKLQAEQELRLQAEQELKLQADAEKKQSYLKEYKKIKGVTLRITL